MSKSAHKERIEWWEGVGEVGGGQGKLQVTPCHGLGLYDQLIECHIDLVSKGLYELILTINTVWLIV